MGLPHKKQWRSRVLRPISVKEALQKRREVARIRNPQIHLHSIHDMNFLQQEIFKDLAKLQKITQDLNFYLSQLGDE